MKTEKIKRFLGFWDSNNDYPTINTRSTPTTETLEKSVKYVQS